MGIRRGFIKTVLGFLDFVLAIILTNIFYPPFSRFLRGIDSLYDAVRDTVSSTLGLDELITGSIGAAGNAANDAINTLPLPQALLDYIIANNNPEVHLAVAATDLSDFVAGFIASIVINVMAAVILFALIYVGLIIATKVLNIIAMLPVIKSLNKLLGGALGAIWGLIMVWVVLGVGVIFFSINTGFAMTEALENSFIARLFHESNFVLNWILRFFP